jgi:hypothetical protein
MYFVDLCACTWQVTEADHARWLEEAQKTFDANEEMTATNPVVGLLGSGPQRKALVSKIGEIRKRQRDIFMDQFKQFPGDKAGAEAESESYSAIWEDFKAKGQQVISRVLLIIRLCYCATLLTRMLQVIRSIRNIRITGLPRSP